SRMTGLSGGRGERIAEAQPRPTSRFARAARNFAPKPVGAGSASPMARSRSARYQNRRRLLSLYRGSGYTLPTRSRKSSTYRSPRFAAARSARIRGGQQSGGINAGRRLIVSWPSIPDGGAAGFGEAAHVPSNVNTGH